MQCSPAAVAPRRQLMHGIDVTTLRNTLARPGGGYFSPGLKQRLEPKAWCLLVSFLKVQAASPRVFSRGILAPPAAAAEEDDDSKSIPKAARRRSVSEVRTPRPFPMPSLSTDDEQGERIEGGAA